jgi:hypothetical protein
VIVAHIAGIPVEESIVQLVPGGAAIVTAVAIAARMSLGRLRRSSLDADPTAERSRRRQIRRGVFGK